MIPSEIPVEAVWFGLKRVLIWIFLIVTTILVHEYGHAWAFTKYTKKEVDFHLERSGRFGWSIVMGDEKDMALLTPQQFQVVTMVGVVFGLVPFAIFYWILTWYEVALFLILYLWGCWNDDIKNMIGDDVK